MRFFGSRNTDGLPKDRPVRVVRRSGKRRFLIGFNIFLATVMVAGVVGLGYTKWRFGQIDKIDLGSVLSGDSSGPDMTVLLVGSDTREELANGQSKQFGSAQVVGGQRSDTIMLLRVESKQKRAAILSIPRDTYVTIYSAEGKSMGKSRINSAYESGAKSLIKTITTNFQIPIDHYAEVNFDSFRSIVSAMDGVPVRFDSPARDSYTGLNITAAGCVNLTGDQALSYVRSRHYQSYEGGRWKEHPDADLGRIDRQQDFIRRVLRKAIDKGSRNPLTLNALIGASVKSVKLDEGFSIGDITKLGKRFQSFDPNDVDMLKLPGANANIGGASVLTVKQDEAKQTIDRFLHGPPQEAKPADIPVGSISVRVLNGSGTPGEASDTADALKEAGFVVATTGDAKSFGATKTSIRYATGQKSEAEVLASYVQGPTQLTVDSTLKGVDVVLTTSNSFEGISEPGKTTSTTAATSSTTVPSKPQPSAAPNESAC